MRLKSLLKILPNLNVCIYCKDDDFNCLDLTFNLKLKRKYLNARVKFLSISNIENKIVLFIYLNC